MSLVTSTCPHSAMKSHHPHSEGQFLIDQLHIHTIRKFKFEYIVLEDSKHLETASRVVKKSPRLPSQTFRNLLCAIAIRNCPRMLAHPTLSGS